MHRAALAGRSGARRRAGLALATVLAVAVAAPAAAAPAPVPLPAPAPAAVPLLPTAPARTVGFDGLVYASAYVGSTVYLGGSFRNAIVDGRAVPRKRLAAVDARTGELLPWAPATNGTVWALAASGTTLYAGGRFTTVAGQPRPGLAGVDLTTGAVGPLRHTVAGEVRALAAGGGRLYAGGSLTTVDGRTVHNLAAFRLPGGALDTAFKASADREVKALAVAGSRLYVGGAFKRINGADGTARLVALRLTDGAVNRAFRPGTPYDVMALSVAGQRVYAGLAGPGGRVAAYGTDGALAWSTVTDGDVQAVAYLNGVVYAGGHFVLACPQPSRTATSWCPATLRDRSKLVAFDPAGGALLDWNPGADGRWGILTMSVEPGSGALAVGGEFATIGGRDRSRFALFRDCGYRCGYESEVDTR